MLLFKKKRYLPQPLFFKGLGTKGNKVTKYIIILYIYIITRFKSDFWLLKKLPAHFHVLFISKASKFNYLPGAKLAVWSAIALNEPATNASVSVALTSKRSITRILVKSFSKAPAPMFVDNKDIC